MIIDKIETKRNKTVLYFGENATPFAPEIIQKYHISEGETDPKTFFAAKEESDRLLCRRALYTQIDRSEKCKKAYLDALVDKGFFYPIAQATVDEAESRGLISDRRYAECYIHLNENTKGWYRICGELRAKGVSDDVLSSLREEFGNKTKECKKIAEKMMKNMEKTYQNKQKLYAKLARRGYAGDEINAALDGFFDDIFPDD